MKKHKKIVLKRYMFFWTIFSPLAWVVSKFKGYKIKSRLKMKKGESYIILSNHQAVFDGVFMGLSFSRPFATLTSDSFFSSRIGRFVSHLFPLISKKKGALDVRCTMDMMKVIKEGGSLAFYPEGNRTYAEFQFPFTDRFGELLRVFGKKIVIFNVHGGFGCYPRFGKKGRKGSYYGEIKRIIQPEEYANLSNEEFEQLLKDNLWVDDSINGCAYKSNYKAEYLERMFFVCPNCGKMQTLVSKGNHIVCTSCGLDVEYTENLSLKSNNKAFKYTKLIEWYNHQIRYLKGYEVPDGPIFMDSNCKLFISNPYEKRKLIAKGSIVLYKDKIEFGSKVDIPIADIDVASPVNGTDLVFSVTDKNYLIKGNERFNPLKYALMFNKLNTKLKETRSDIYYPLVER